jgi:hypothetical protein
LVIHPERHEVLKDGEPLELTATEFRVLPYLASASFSAATQKLASSVLDSRQPNTLRPCQLRQRPLFGQGRQRYLRLEDSSFSIYYGEDLSVMVTG